MSDFPYGTDDAERFAMAQLVARAERAEQELARERARADAAEKDARDIAGHFQSCGDCMDCLSEANATLYFRVDALIGTDPPPDAGQEDK